MTKERKSTLTKLQESVKDLLTKYTGDVDFSKDENLKKLIEDCDKVKEAATLVRKRNAKKLIKQHQAAIDELKNI